MQMLLRLFRHTSIFSKVLLALMILVNVSTAHAAENGGIWQADLGNGFYKNPVLHADYSDLDVVAVNGHYYMTSSSFNSAPGLPILHSTDLVNWQLINYALPQQVPLDHFATPRHGEGVWAPNIRFHDGKFWIFYPDPDFGIYVTTATDPAKAWSEPKLILAGKGIIDPTPLWDADGKSYLLHGWAKSRAGFNNVLSLREMAADTSWVSDKYVHIVDGSKLKGYRTIEGPKFYQRNGYYYIFAPAGGVDLGWQSVYRAKNIEGPYEAKIVMAQGNSVTNGPHQGTWVHTEFGEDWFLHFQAKKAYGRIVHLQPMQWINDWPVIGIDKDGDGIGQPVQQFKKPKAAGKQAITPLVVNDEFAQTSLGLTWQWNANYQDSWYSLTAPPGQLRLFTQPKIKTTGDNLWMTPSLIMQKIPADQFAVVSKITLSQEALKAQSGLVLFGEDYAWIGVQPDKITGKANIVFVHCNGARKGCDESVLEQKEFDGQSVELRMMMQPGASAVFSYRTDASQQFTIIGEHFQAVRGRWVGAKIGFFSVAEKPQKNQYMDVDYIRFNELD
ncbi:MAG: glycoside hydrolase 43 family protein [Paraglaciecola sp.]|uniref:glycoside hydrolase family 43 protein n=1 Tax=Paraglaciecola sp. TaxID=1920173 RepID=UPI0032978E9A